MFMRALKSTQSAPESRSPESSSTLGRDLKLPTLKSTVISRDVKLESSPTLGRVLSWATSSIYFPISSKGICATVGGLIKFDMKVKEGKNGSLDYSRIKKGRIRYWVLYVMLIIYII